MNFQTINPYGDGNACKKIENILEEKRHPELENAINYLKLDTKYMNSLYDLINSSLDTSYILHKSRVKKLDDLINNCDLCNHDVLTQE